MIEAWFGIGMMVFQAQNGLEQTRIGIEAAGVQNGVIRSQEPADGCLQGLVLVLGSTNKPYGRQTKSVLVHGLLRRLDEVRIVGQAQVVVRTKVQDFRTRIHLDVGCLIRNNDSFMFVQTSLMDGIEFYRKCVLYIPVHRLLPQIE